MRQKKIYLDKIGETYIENGVLGTKDNQIERTCVWVFCSTNERVRQSFYHHCTHEKFDFIFAGPPYALDTIDEIPKIIINRQLLNPEGLFVLEHTPRNRYENYPGFVKQRNYGTTIFSFFQNAESGGKND